MLLSAAGIAASAVLLFFFARGGAAWALGFVALVPWLRALDAKRLAASAAGTLLSAIVMSLALTAAMFAWFGLAMAGYAQGPGAAGLALLLALAPLFQPQVLVFALARHFARRRFGVAIGALAGSAAWVATEWAWPKLLGDTLGHGLYPSLLLRQGAEVGGAAGLTFALLCANEALAAAWERGARGAHAVHGAHRARGADRWRAAARPLALAVSLPLALALFGLAVPTEPPANAGERVRMGLVQSNIVDYERLRRAKGASAVVREVLDTHYAMSHDAVQRQQAQALLWSETVYPTTFGRPKSEAGAELDREIAAIVNAAGVPLVFGTYEGAARDPAAAGSNAAAEYNAAAFLAPGRGLVGFYRKTRLFPFTEALPAWLETPWLRNALPWAGAWKAGDGARVLPLLLADGREVPVLPLICLDDVDTQLAIDGARLGARLIVTMSNDSWFTEHAQGAELHLAVAAFRSIETRLPQFRVTSNGYSAVIDARGEVLAGTRMGERTLVVGDLPAREPRRTLMVMWGDWVGRAGAVFLLALMMVAAFRAWRSRAGKADAAANAAASATPSASAAPMAVAVLTPAARWTAALLRVFAYGSLAWLTAKVLAGDGALASNTLAQLRAFAALVLAPEAAALALLWASRATLSVQGGVLALARGERRIELAARDVVAVRAWALPLPVPGATLMLRSGGAWSYSLARADAVALQAVLGAGAGAGPGTAMPSPSPSPSPAWAARYGQAFLAPRGSAFLHHRLTRFVLLPFLLAIPAFTLHQHIAFGSAFGEARLFGFAAYARGLAMWWAAWGIGIVAAAAALRGLIEAGTLAAVLWRPARVLAVRRALERLGLAALYLGVPGWLALRMLAG